MVSPKMSRPGAPKMESRESSESMESNGLADLALVLAGAADAPG